MRRLTGLFILGLACLLATWARAQELRVPERVVANAGATIATSGSGDATSAGVLKKSVKLGEEIAITPEDVRSTGRYTAVLRAGAAKSATQSFYVAPAPPAAINFLARPSRVPVQRPEVISGVAFVFDDYRNLVLDPANVTFNLAVGDAAPVSRTVAARNGIAWTRLDSARRAGAAQFVASIGNTQVRRVVQQTASDPCNLHFRALPSQHPSQTSITVETDPVRDCAGNPVPDGTIVTFSEFDGHTRSTIDARIKRGVARAELPAAPGATISVASGVVLGNEVRWGGGR